MEESNKIYVVIGKDVKERESTLKWTLKTFIGNNICVIYVHVPAKIIPLPNGLILPVRCIRNVELEAFRAQERKEVLQLLDDCRRMCNSFQAPCETKMVEKASIKEGIVELIHQMRIEKLVMGAAANDKYWWGMTNLMSEKAKYVHQFAPDFCHVWFVCSNQLISQREVVSQKTPIVKEVLSDSSEILLPQISPGSSKGSEPVSRRPPPKPNQSSTFSASGSSSTKSRVPHSCNENLGSSSPSNKSNINGNLLNQLEQAIPKSESSSRDACREPVSSCTAEKQDTEAIRTVKPVERPRYGELIRMKTENMKQMFSKVPLQLSETLDHKLSLESQNEQIRLQVKMLEEQLSETLDHKSSLESQNEQIRRKVKMLEEQLSETLDHKLSLESQNEQIRLKVKMLEEQLSETLDHKLSLESQNEEIRLKAKMLEENMLSELEKSQKCKEERDKMQIERDSTLKEAQALSEQLAQRPSCSVDPVFSEFSPLELERATDGYNESLKIGEGSYGSMYKGFLHHTQVAIKLLRPNIVQNQLEFDEQVCCISKLRHPNIVTLMGACREPLALVYEYLPNGNLENALISQNLSTTPLPWQIRVRIAMDICSALIFLHSSRPACIAQGDLTPAKLLLDANFNCKITDFGIVSKDSTPSNLFITRAFKPEPHNRKPANLESDVYSFGIIMLQLLTGKQATLGLITQVKSASRTGALDRILDPFAGKWPSVQAEQLAHMALRCCDINKRPDLAADVWRVLAPMRASCPGSSLVPMASDDRPPEHFLCPIFKETMKDPYIAADGSTYEAEAIRRWFDDGHVTSPMTNVKLANLNLIPNRALQSAIQEWLSSTST